MADAISIRDANGVIVPVSVDDVATLNGATVDTHIQRFKLVFGPDATAQDVDATHPLPVSGAVSVTNFPATQPVSGSVSVSNLPGTQPVSLSPGSPTTFADAGTITATTYRGITIKNTSTTANAEIAIRNQGPTGMLLETVTLGPNESVRETYPAGRNVPNGTIYMQLVSGTVSGTVFS